MTGSGIPDSNYCCQGVEGWVEFKTETGWLVRLRPFQISWLLQRSRAGGNCFVAVRQKLKLSEALWLYPGSAADAISQRGGMKSVEPLVWSEGGPAKWDWAAIESALLAPGHARALELRGNNPVSSIGLSGCSAR
jgi:hypothetical protein